MLVLGLILSVLVGVALGFFGGGGSILTVPLLVYVFGIGPKEAIASSLLIVAIASVSGALQHYRLGNLRLKVGLVFGAAGMSGAYLGGRIGAFIDGGVLLLLFASMMVLTSLAMWRARGEGASEAVGDHATAKLLAEGFAVGVFTGLVGAGGGFLIVPALTLWAGLPIAAAVGTSLFVIVLKSTAGYLGYASHVAVDYPLVALVSGCAVAGSFVGTRLARRVDPASVRRAFAGFVLAMAAVILVRESATLVETAGEALPTTLPQIVFALLVLGVGILAGRATRRGSPEPIGREFSGGVGI